MLRLDRNDLGDIPRPVYELIVERDGPDARVSVMVSNDTPLACRIELFSIGEPSDFSAAVERWLRGLPYFEPDHAVWQQVARTCASRFTAHIFLGTKEIA